MLKDMKRRFYLNINQFQKPILNLSLAATFLTIIILAICISFFSYDIAKLVVDPHQEIPLSKLLVTLLLIILPLSYLVVIYFSLKISNRMVGSVERVLRELDEIIETKQKKHIRARRDDDLTNALLQRINTLIDRMS